MKQNPFFSFVLRLLAISLALGAAMYMLKASGNINLSVKAMGLMFATLFGVTSISYYMVMQAVSKSPRSFTNAFMMSSFSRLLIYGAIIALYCRWHQAAAIQFAVAFFALYIVYTGFEIKSLLGFMKGK